MSTAPIPTAKACRVCGQAKPLERFARDAKCRDGCSTKCKDCMKAYSTARYERQRRQTGRAYRPTLRAQEWLAIEARGTLRCRVCQVDKALDAFRISYRAPRRRRTCRECERQRSAELHLAKSGERRAYYQKLRCRRYGLTPADFDRMLAAQQGNCAVCGQPLGERHQTIDHCHRTGKVRGIVHAPCNLVLGNAREDIEVLRGAIAYLTRQGAGQEDPRASATNQGERP
jgi:hypothetical protein